MRIAVTGGTGFVGRWLIAELIASGHEPTTGNEPTAADRGRDAGAVAPHGPDVTDRDALRAWLVRASPDAIVHLAAIAAPAAAARDPAAAFSVNVGGTVSLFEVVRELPSRPAVLVAGSSEVYGAPAADASPLSETAAIWPRGVYGLSKAAQEAVAIASAGRHGVRVAVTRSFNHTGPGQRPTFVVPALAERIRDLRDAGGTALRVGNVDVRRDFTDVRDVVRAYRLVVESLVSGAIVSGAVLNVASGRAVPIRWFAERLGELAGIAPDLVPDPALVRADDPPEIAGDASLLTHLTGWRPRIALDATVRDVWESVTAGA